MSAFNMNQGNELMEKLVHHIVFSKTRGTSFVTQEMKTLFEQSRKAAAINEKGSWVTEMERIQTIPPDWPAGASAQQ